MSNYAEIRRVRHEMSEKTGHNIYKLIEQINRNKYLYVRRIIHSETQDDKCNTQASTPEIKQSESE